MRRGSDPVCVEEAGGGGADERRGGRARGVAGDLEPRPARAGDRVEVDDGDDVAPVRRGVDESGRRRAPRSARRRWTGRRSGGRRRPGAARSRRPGRSRTRGASSTRAAVPDALSFAPGPVAGVVAVGHDDDRRLRLPRPAHDRGDVPEPSAAEAGDRRPRTRRTWTGRPYGCSCRRSQPTAATARRVSPAAGRDAPRPGRGRASAAVCSSKAGGSAGAASAGGRATLNAATSSGRPISSQVPR